MAVLATRARDSRRGLNVLANDARVSGGDAQQRNSWPLGPSATLLPVAQGAH
jgi:hypothetical protein